jgi:hypothetical protein
MTRRGARARIGGLLALGLAFAVAGCSGANTQASAPTKQVAQRESSASESISASDALLLKALETTPSFIDLHSKAEQRAAELEVELRSVPLVIETTLALPGVSGTDVYEGSVAGRSGLIHATGEFDEALTHLSPVKYFRATGLKATAGQLRAFRDALQGIPPSTEGTLAPDALSDLKASLQGSRCGDEHTLRLPSPRNGSVERWGCIAEGRRDPVFFWLRTQQRGKRWYVTASGRDASWTSRSYVGKVRTYLALREWVGASGEKNYAKPVIYLYPSAEQSVTVRLGFRGVLTSTSPVIDPASAWTVRARPDGALTDTSGRRWPYLFWEGTGSAAFDLTTGHVIRGSAADSYLRTALAQRGLSTSESAEFREYWVPILSANPWVLMHWEGETYERHAPLEVTPRPDTSIRVFMVAKPLDAPVVVTPQRLAPPPARRGFTLVEWGGALAP